MIHFPPVITLSRCPVCAYEVPPEATACPRDGADLRDPTRTRDPLVGATLGEYVIRRRLGEGGMGVVYEGEQPVIGKHVAVKILHPEIAQNPVPMQRFIDEARAVNAIRHRGIVDIFSFGKLPDGRQYMVMELLDGEPLDQLSRDRAPMLPGEALPILAETHAALAAAPRAGVAPRDLHP